MPGAHREWARPVPQPGHADAVGLPFPTAWMIGAPVGDRGGARRAVGIGGGLLPRRRPDEEPKQAAPAPPRPRSSSTEAATAQAPPQDLGFPEFATKNTTRVAGADPVADAAAVALAVFPSTGGVPGPDAVTLVDAERLAVRDRRREPHWPHPVGAPDPAHRRRASRPLTAGALDARSAPQGSAATAGRQAFAIGGAAAPRGLDVQHVTGKDPAEIAAADRRAAPAAHRRQAGRTSCWSAPTSPQYAMPAAAWAARSGDPVLFVEPGRGAEADGRGAQRPRRAYRSTSSGPPSAISAPRRSTRCRQRRAGRGADRRRRTRSRTRSPSRATRRQLRLEHQRPGPRLRDRHADTAAGRRRGRARCRRAAPGGRSWSPTTPRRSPTRCASYLLDIKPGYVNDPTRAVYNHVWLIGDADAALGRPPGAGRRSRRGRAGNVRHRDRRPRRRRRERPSRSPTSRSQSRQGQNR